MRLHAQEFAELDLLSTLFSACRNKRIFLTGGTGFFGKWLIESLLYADKLFGLNVHVTVLSRRPSEFLAHNPWHAGENALTFMQGDVRDFTFPGGNFDFLIHAASEVNAALERDRPDELYAVITGGTLRVLELARRCSAQRLLLVSSGAVYGPQPAALSHVPESFEGTPATAYGRGKKVSEQMCLEASAAGGAECVIARPFAFVGPYLPLDAHYAIGNFIRDALAGRPIILNSDGRPLRSYLYAADLAVWLWTLLIGGKKDTAYNVGSPDAISLADLARLVAKLGGERSEIIVKGVPDPAVPPPRYIPDTSLAEKSLGLKVSCPLPEAILRTMAFAAGTRPASAQAGAPL